MNPEVDAHHGKSRRSVRVSKYVCQPFAMSLQILKSHGVRHVGAIDQKTR